MNIIKEQDLRQLLKGNPAGGYLFFGEEDYLKEYYVSAVKKAVAGDPSFAAFNEIIIDEENFSPEKLAETIMFPPMMNEYKFIELKGFDFNSMKQSTFDELCDALSGLKEYEFNVLILNVSSELFDAGYLPKRPSEQLVKLAEHLTAVQFETNTTKKLAGWAGKHFASNKVDASPETCDFFVEYCGKNMFVLNGEIEKVSAFVKSREKSALTKEDIKEACVQGTEFGAFTFSNAILDGESGLALSVLSIMKNEKKEPIAVMSDVIRIYSDMLAVKILCENGATSAEVASKLKIHEYTAGLYVKSVSKIPMEKLKKAISLCKETDIKLKNTTLGYVAIERLICSI